jgi:hypothetical protein
MRESRLYGSVRGALSNERPYRDRGACHPAALCADPLARNDVDRLNVCSIIRRFIAPQPDIPPTWQNRRE